MKKHLTVGASFIVMLCIGSVYAWSTIANQLIKSYGFTGAQTQLVFGSITAVFPVTMIFIGQLSERMKHKYFGYISGVLFMSGYLLAGYSHGNFLMIFLGIGILGGIATGCGYWVSLTLSVRSFPEKKGLITGIVSAGFGIGAILLLKFSETILYLGYDVLHFFKIVGVVYGLVICIVSNLYYQNLNEVTSKNDFSKTFHLLKTTSFSKLFAGMFFGSFAGLLIIGSLTIIGSRSNISHNILALSIVLFAIANFCGRLFWGFFSDHFNGRLSIFFALLLQSIAILSLNIIELSAVSFLIITMLIGFGFGGNFVLFAKETVQIYGVEKLGTLYPFVFIGYAIAGITGPLSGGLLYDFTGSFFYGIALASTMSFLGSLIFFIQYVNSKKINNL